MLPFPINAERYQEIDEIFQTALGLSPDERTSYIRQACGDDESLLTEVEYLLASDENGWELINTPAFEMAAPLLVADRPELSAEERLGHYRIISLLGAGGMGQVYLAEDTRLGRKVALKLLPTGFIRREARLRRFWQEAQAVSALNHPNIVTIYDIWEVEGRNFIATEYIEGETLGRRIKKGSLSEDDTSDIAIQVASALSAAHQAGIIHRDIKPENIMLRRDGLVKVLDFGLAKLTESPLTNASRSDAVAEEREEPLFREAHKQVTSGFNTESGLLMGTLPYMSPEQLNGERLDARTDIFSLGVVLYEMVTGQSPFHKEKTADVVAAILQKDGPPLSKRSPESLSDLQRIIARALQKDRGERYQSMQELLIDLRDRGKGRADARPWRWRLVWGLAALVVVSASGVYRWLTRPPAKPPIFKLSKLAAYGFTSDPAVSPDGKYLAFVSNLAGEGHTDIWLRPFDRDEPTRLTDTQGNVSNPDFSPDGTRIAFANQGGGHDGIFIVSTLGGEPRLVAERGDGPRWSPDGKWIAYSIIPEDGSYGPDSNRKIFLLPATGGEPRQFRPDFLTASIPVWSPDGTHIIFMGLRDREQRDNDWWVAPTEGGEAVKTGTIDIFIRHQLSAPPRRWTPDDYILFTSSVGGDAESTDLWRIPLDAGSWKTQDRPERLTSGTGQIFRVVSLLDGRLVFSDQHESINLWSMPIDVESGRVTAEPQQITRDEAHNVMPSLSADGDKLVYGSTRGGRGIFWFRDLKSGREVKLTSPDAAFLPQVSPDGKALVFGTYEGQPAPGALTNIFITSLDGGEAERLAGGIDLSPQGWLFTRNQVLCAGGYDSVAGPQVLLLDIATKKSQVVLGPGEWKYSEIFPSPDDRWISFMAVKEGQSHLLIAPLHSNRPTPESEWRSATDSSGKEDQPRWSPSGRLLYFVSARDGSQCIWAQRLDPVSKRPLGNTFAILHLHDNRRIFDGLAVARNRIVFARGEQTSSIWLAEPQ
jgi:serine/threonine protein kinase